MSIGLVRPQVRIPKEFGQVRTSLEASWSGIPKLPCPEDNPLRTRFTNNDTGKSIAPHHYKGPKFSKYVVVSHFKWK